ncbi:hypothetical protein VIBNISO65_790043 [Vibrio nigripulchritudo SO65]|nr:hypothetical protein VIBNIFTn2_1030007 [Vibrio nigripulchritudo FTn2]CCN64357.1 hypothetical protein VIBNIPon4_210007 [Vibrio nigripulchritudo POn4]CCN78974.1 hypothetical protein VIBNISO65_790043 [Vibrio nigripulchritudo SO65]
MFHKTIFTYQKWVWTVFKRHWLMNNEWKMKKGINDGDEKGSAHDPVFGQGNLWFGREHERSRIFRAYARCA